MPIPVITTRRLVKNLSVSWRQNCRSELEERRGALLRSRADIA
jgi:hypothetical protein